MRVNRMERKDLLTAGGLARQADKLEYVFYSNGRSKRLP